MQRDIHYAEAGHVQVARETLGEPRAATVNTGQHGAFRTVWPCAEPVAIGSTNLLEQSAV